MSEIDPILGGAAVVLSIPFYRKIIPDVIGTDRQDTIESKTGTKPGDLENRFRVKPGTEMRRRRKARIKGLLGQAAIIRIEEFLWQVYRSLIPHC